MTGTETSSSSRHSAARGAESCGPISLRDRSRNSRPTLGEGSPCPLRALRAAGRRDAARQARGRSQRSAMARAGEQQPPDPAARCLSLVRVLSAAPPESLPTGRALCRALTHGRSPAQGAQTGACPIHTPALTRHGTPSTSCTPPLREVR